MTDQITLEEALQLVSFYYASGSGWRVRNVYRDVDGTVGGTVHGTINGRGWEFIETPKEKLQRLITESGNQELMKAFNQLENN